VAGSRLKRRDLKKGEEKAVVRLGSVDNPVLKEPSQAARMRNDGGRYRLLIVFYEWEEKKLPRGPLKPSRNTYRGFFKEKSYCLYNGSALPKGSNEVDKQGGGKTLGRQLFAEKSWRP